MRIDKFKHPVAVRFAKEIAGDDADANTLDYLLQVVEDLARNIPGDCLMHAIREANRKGGDEREIFVEAVSWLRKWSEPVDVVLQHRQGPSKQTVLEVEEEDE